MRQVGLVGRWFVIAGGCVRRGEDEPPRTGPSRRIEQPQRLGDVDLERPERIADRIGDAGPGREVDDGVDVGDGVGDDGRIGQPSLDELMRDAGEIRLAPDRQIVENPDGVAAFDEQPDQRRADEAGAAGDENGSVQRRCASADTPTSAFGPGAQRTFWTNVAGSI
jgi:hypothetical protein